MKASEKKGVEMENIWCAGGPSFLPIDSISPHLLEHLGLMHHVDLDPNYSLPLFIFLILSLSEIYMRWSALGLKKCDVASFHLDDPHLNPSKCYFGRVRVFFSIFPAVKLTDPLLGKLHQQAGIKLQAPQHAKVQI